MAVTLSLHKAYALVLQRMEAEAWNTKLRTSYRHAAEVCRSVLQRTPYAWRIYRAGIAAGLPSEYQRRVRRAPRTPRQQAWAALEREARVLVAQSAEPMTLRDAVLALVQTPDGQALYHAYRATPVDRRPSLGKATRKKTRTRALG